MSFNERNLHQVNRSRSLFHKVSVKNTLLVFTQVIFSLNLKTSGSSHVRFPQVRILLKAVCFVFTKNSIYPQCAYGGFTDVCVLFYQSVFM